MSKEVKRYYLLCHLDEDSREVSSLLDEDRNGEWVRYSDYEALLEENKQLRGLYKMHQETETREMRDLRAERDALLAERDAIGELLTEERMVSSGMVDLYRDACEERDGAHKDAERARMRVKELDLLFGRYLLAMKAALIDADQRGDEYGMRWIYNSLAGPGELPAEDEIDAQAFFDREIKPINDAMAELFAALQGAQP